MDTNLKLGIGTVQFGMDYGISNFSGKTPLNEVKEVFKILQKYKIKTIDTAKVYGDSEKTLGNFNLDNFKIVSKFMPSNTFGTINYQFNDSLKKLKLDKIYAFIAHKPLTLLDDPKQWSDLNNLKAKGKIKKIGYSINNKIEINKLMDFDLKPDIIQIPYNYFDNRFEDIIKNLKKEGCEIHARSIFLQGLFFSKTKKLNKFFKPISKKIDFLQNNYKNLSGELLNYVINNKNIDKIIIGVNNSNQLIQNIESIKYSIGLPKLKNNIPSRILNPSMWKY